MSRWRLKVHRAVPGAGSHGRGNALNLRRSAGALEIDLLGYNRRKSTWERNLA